VPSGPISNMVSLLEAVGVIVVNRTLFTDAQDAVSTWPRDGLGPPLMLVNLGLAPDRERFTMAHELGHLIMHALPEDDQETQADRFASEFLAPADEIAPQLAVLSDLGRRICLLVCTWFAQPARVWHCWRRPARERRAGRAIPLARTCVRTLPARCMYGVRRRRPHSGGWPRRSVCPSGSSAPGETPSASSAR
jgi:hypothetical protein